MSRFDQPTRVNASPPQAHVGQSKPAIFLYVVSGLGPGCGVSASGI